MWERIDRLEQENLLLKTKLEEAKKVVDPHKYCEIVIAGLKKELVDYRIVFSKLNKEITRLKQKAGEESDSSEKTGGNK